MSKNIPNSDIEAAAKAMYELNRDAEDHPAWEDWHDPDRQMFLADAAAALEAAGYRKPFELSPGTYRNQLGVELEVTTLVMARHILGPVWNAYQKDDLFPRHLVVTPEGMRDAGYERVEATQ